MPRGPICRVRCGPIRWGLGRRWRRRIRRTSLRVCRGRIRRVLCRTVRRDLGRRPCGHVRRVLGGPKRGVESGERCGPILLGLGRRWRRRNRRRLARMVRRGVRRSAAGRIGRESGRRLGRRLGRSVVSRRKRRRTLCRLFGLRKHMDHYTQHMRTLPRPHSEWLSYDYRSQSVYTHNQKSHVSQ